MLLIIAHHFVVNSNLWSALKESPITFNTYFLYMLSAWGKPAIDGFMLITGFFMCKQNITVKKYAKLLFQILFYNIIIGCIFVTVGKIDLSFKSIYMMLMPYTNVGRGFVGCFILFYLFIPFLNKLVNCISQKEHLALIVLCLFMYSFLEMAPTTEYEMNYVSWFCVTFFVGAYIRFYSLPKEDNTALWASVSTFLFLLGLASVVVGVYTGKFTLYFLGEANRLLAIAIAVSTFMTFKSINIGSIMWINVISASTFGVLLIHANSGAMRQWLWNETVKASDCLASEYCVLYAISCVIVVFCVCSAIDIIRKKLVEEPMFQLIEKLKNKLWHK